MSCQQLSIVDQGKVKLRLSREGSSSWLDKEQLGLHLYIKSLPDKQYNQWRHQH